MGWAHVSEHRTEAGLSIDLARVDAKVAVEIDGPWHYLTGSDDRQHLDGRTVLKRRLLEASGWRLVSVPVFDWDELAIRDDAVDAKRAYLREKLGDLIS